MKNRTWFVAVLILCAVSLMGCGTATNKAKKIERMLVFGADSSGSMDKKARERYSGIMETIVSKQKGKATIHIYRFALDVDTVYQANPKSVEDIFSAVDNQVAVNGKEVRRGTKFAAMIDKFAAECIGTKLPVYGVILSDGGATDLQATMDAVKRLAKIQNFKGLFVAPVINGAIRSKLERVLAPLGERLTIRSWEDLHGGLQEFCREMKKNSEEVE